MDMDHFLKYFLWKLILMRFSLKKKKTLVNKFGQLCICRAEGCCFLKSLPVLPKMNIYYFDWRDFRMLT